MSLSKKLPIEENFILLTSTIKRYHFIKPIFILVVIQEFFITKIQNKQECAAQFVWKKYSEDI